MNGLVRTLALAAMSLALAGCVAQHRGSTERWFATHHAVPPRADHRVTVCHGFGCYWKSPVRFSPADLSRMRRIIGRPSNAAAERRALARLVSWAEKRVAPEAGSAGDVGGLDIQNARKRGQMDCIDEATNTTSYLMLAEAAGLLRHHTIGSPVARGFFLDGRYPHATAVLVDQGGTPWAIDSWPAANGVPPEISKLEDWFAASPARWGGFSF